MRWLPYILAIGVCTPWLVIAAGGNHPAPTATAVLAGLSILGAAFLLSWACEVAEEDVPQALAVSVLALVAVLPEYAVDATFAWKAAHDPAHAGYAIANMTGGNRLMLGVGWSVVGILTWLRSRRTVVELPRDVGAEVSVLLLATLYAMVPVWRGSLTLVDTAVYLVLYTLYLAAAARGEEHESEQVGPAAALASQAPAVRRTGVLLLLLFAASTIFIAAEPFAEALVESGKHLGVDEFVLVQWVAPLASESPEMLVAVLMVWRGTSSTGLRALVSSSVNQWTLLVGTLAVVYSISKGAPGALPLDHRQATEVLLTAAQCLFGVAVLADLRLQLWQGVLLAALFVIQPMLPDAHAAFGAVYIGLFLAVVLLHPASRMGVVQSFRTFFTLLRGGFPKETHEH